MHGDFVKLVEETLNEKHNKGFLLGFEEFDDYLINRKEDRKASYDQDWDEEVTEPTEAEKKSQEKYNKWLNAVGGKIKKMQGKGDMFEKFLHAFHKWPGRDYYWEVNFDNGTNKKVKKDAMRLRAEKKRSKEWYDQYTKGKKLYDSWY